MLMSRRHTTATLLTAGALFLAGIGTAPAAAAPEPNPQPEPEHPWQAPDWPQTQPWQEADAQQLETRAEEQPEILTRPGAPEPIDPQHWVNPDHMTWDDDTPVPGTDWADPDQEASEQQFHGALVLADYADQPFAVTQEPESTVFGNPSKEAHSVPRGEAAQFYHDFINTPSELNRGHTIHEYWMEGSGGRYGVDLEAFGPYEMPGLSFEYGIGNFQTGEDCPSGYECHRNFPDDARAAWLEAEGGEVAEEFDFVFFVTAGNDESGTWQEFGPMMWENPEDVPDEFGPPDPNMPNFANTRYVDWTSWAAAANYWPHAGSGYSVQAESSAQGTYAHEFSHILGIADNYNNPYGDPLRRTYTGIWGNLSRGIFNGPGGPHTRFLIPATAGGSMGAHHMLRDKMELEMVDGDNDVLHLSRDGLTESGLAVAPVTARSAVTAGDRGLAGVNVVLDGGDLSPECDWTEDLYCDGADYDNYTVEAVDRMGFDSFTPDNGVLLSKTKDEDSAPFVWTVDANPEDIEIVDFVWPDGTEEYITLGDYRQLSDAAFHAGTGSGSEYEYVDEDNRLHFYILDLERDADGVLTYDVAVRSLDGSGEQERGVELSRAIGIGKPRQWAKCEIPLANIGEPGEEEHTGSDVYRLSAEARANGWEVWLPNALAAAEAGEETTVEVYAHRSGRAVPTTRVAVTATSESDPSVSETTTCRVVA